MSLINTIKNTITQPPRDKDIIVNTGGTDTGINIIPIVQDGKPTSTTTTAQDERKFEDLQLVKKNIFNYRLALELDPTVWSSVISMVMVADKEYEIVGNDNADEKAIQHIKDKIREWDLSGSMMTTRYKGIVDGRCFIEKYIKPGTVTIESLTHQAYDSGNYDFVEVKDPFTGNILGYKQKARVYPIPSNWQAMKLDMFIGRGYEDKETNFKPDQVFMPRFIYGDGVSEGLVSKVLDDAYILKELKNMIPVSVKMGAATLGVEMGNAEGKFEPYNPGDTYEEKEAKVRAKMAEASKDFVNKWEKEVVFYSYGVTPRVIGQGQLQDFTPQIEFIKQEIRAGLLTPDSRFESASSNRAVAQEQLSGSMGQVKIIDYINNNYIRTYYEKSVFDHELLLNGFDESIGHIWIEWEEDDREDEVLLMNIGDSLSKIRPDFFTPENDIGIQAYYPRIVPLLQSQTEKKGQTNLDDYKTENISSNVEVDEEGNPITVTNSYGGVRDVHNPLAFLNSVKERLVEEGDLI